MTSSPMNRRAALGALASVPALAILPAVAGPSSATLLSALIEAHRTARAAFCDTIDPLEAAEPDLEAVTPSFDDAAPYQAHQRKDDIAEQIEEDFAAELKRTATISALSPALGEQALAVLEARKAFCVARLEEAFADHSLAETAYNSASNAEDEALMAICEHRCSSLEEAAIRAKYLGDFPVDLQTEHIDALFASFLPEGENDPEGLANV
jgi:aminopeptidase N